MTEVMTESEWMSVTRGSTFCKECGRRIPNKQDIKGLCRQCVVKKLSGGQDEK